MRTGHPKTGARTLPRSTALDGCYRMGHNGRWGGILLRLERLREKVGRRRHWKHLGTHGFPVRNLLVMRPQFEEDAVGAKPSRVLQLIPQQEGSHSINSKNQKVHQKMVLKKKSWLCGLIQVHSWEPDRAEKQSRSRSSNQFEHSHLKYIRKKKSDNEPQPNTGLSKPEQARAEKKQVVEEKHGRHHQGHLCLDADFDIASDRFDDSDISMTW